MNGIGYSGTLAYVGVVSTFLAVLINLRWDIEIMVNNQLALHESLFDSSNYNSYDNYCFISKYNCW